VLLVGQPPGTVLTPAQLVSGLSGLALDHVMTLLLATRQCLAIASPESAAVLPSLEVYWLLIDSLTDADDCMAVSSTISIIVETMSMVGSAKPEEARLVMDTRRDKDSKRDK
jgi:hypothetical protein